MTPAGVTDPAAPLQPQVAILDRMLNDLPANSPLIPIVRGFRTWVITEATPGVIERIGQIEAADPAVGEAYFTTRDAVVADMCSTEDNVPAPDLPRRAGMAGQNMTSFTPEIAILDRMMSTLPRSSAVRTVITRFRTWVIQNANPRVIDYVEQIENAEAGIAPDQQGVAYYNARDAVVAEMCGYHLFTRPVISSVAIQSTATPPAVLNAATGIHPEQTIRVVITGTDLPTAEDARIEILDAQNVLVATMVPTPPPVGNSEHTELSFALAIPASTALASYNVRVSPGAGYSVEQINADERTSIAAVHPAFTVTVAPVEPPTSHRHLTCDDHGVDNDHDGWVDSADPGCQGDDTVGETHDDRPSFMEMAQAYDLTDLFGDSILANPPLWDVNLDLGGTFPVGDDPMLEYLSPAAEARGLSGQNAFVLRMGAHTGTPRHPWLSGNNGDVVRGGGYVEGDYTLLTPQAGDDDNTSHAVDMEAGGAFHVEPGRVPMDISAGLRWNYTDLRDPNLQRDTGGHRLGPVFRASAGYRSSQELNSLYARIFGEYYLEWQAQSDETPRGQLTPIPFEADSMTHHARVGTEVRIPIGDHALGFDGAYRRETWPVTTATGPAQEGFNGFDLNAYGRFIWRNVSLLFNAGGGALFAEDAILSQQTPPWSVRWGAAVDSRYVTAEYEAEIGVQDTIFYPGNAFSNTWTIRPGRGAGGWSGLFAQLTYGGVWGSGNRWQNVSFNVGLDFYSIIRGANTAGRPRTESSETAVTPSTTPIVASTETDAGAAVSHWTTEAEIRGGVEAFLRQTIEAYARQQHYTCQGNYQIQYSVEAGNRTINIISASPTDEFTLGGAEESELSDAILELFAAQELPATPDIALSNSPIVLVPLNIR
jgi:hypothetical protein